MAFDECAPYPASRDYIEKSMNRTTRWLKRCISANANPDTQALLGLYKVVCIVIYALHMPKS